MTETLVQRLARQMAEVHPGTVCAMQHPRCPGRRPFIAIAPAQGEKEKLA